MKIAILSPQKNAYSETFIQAQIKGLSGNVLYYYEGIIPQKLNNATIAYQISLRSQCYRFFLKRLCGVFNKPYSSTIFNLHRSLLQESADVVLAQYGLVAAETLPAIKKANLPLIVHFHGYDASIESVLNKYKRAYEEVFSYASQIIVVSRDMRKKLISLGCPPKKLLLTYCPPHKSFFTLKPSYTTKKILSVGRFVEKKAPHLTLLAFSKALEKHPDATLTMIGDGPLLSFCKSFAIQLKCSHAVTFLGSQDPQRVQKHMHASSIFLQHSLKALNGDMEGTPVSILEASAASLAIVSTYHAGIKDVLQDGKSGLLVAEGDYQSMSENLITLLDSEKLRSSMGQNANRAVLQLLKNYPYFDEINSALVKAVTQ